MRLCTTAVCNDVVISVQVYGSRGRRRSVACNIRGNDFDRVVSEFTIIRNRTAGTGEDIRRDAIDVNVITDPSAPEATKWERFCYRKTPTEQKLVSARPRRDNTLLATVKIRTPPKSAASLVLIFGNQSKQAVLFVPYPGGEINTVPERKKIPQAIKL